MPNSKQIVYLSQAQYAELIANGTITVDGVTVTYDENDIYVTPQAEPVTDVRVNGTSIAANGVANIPIATSNTAGAFKTNDPTFYINNGNIRIDRPSDNYIISGTDTTRVPTIAQQHKVVFYGLAKAAGDDTQRTTDVSTFTGTYTPEAKGAIQSMLGVSDLIATAENNLVASKAYAVGDVFTANGKLYKVTTAIAVNETIILQNEGEEISGHNAVETSLNDGFVKWTDYACNTTAQTQKAGIIGVTPVWSGIRIAADGGLYLNIPNADLIKIGTDNSRTSLIHQQHLATFYGLAKAAGDVTQSASENAVGTYTDNAKASIKAMLGIVDGSTGTVDVSGTTPTITAVENTRYVCGEVTSLSFTPPSSGISIVRFTSGSTVTVLTIPSTVKFPEWFDPTALETNTIYEICVTDGIYGAVMSWAL